MNRSGPDEWRVLDRAVILSLSTMADYKQFFPTLDRDEDEHYTHARHGTESNVQEQRVHVVSQVVRVMNVIGCS